MLYVLKTGVILFIFLTANKDQNQQIVDTTNNNTTLIKTHQHMLCSYITMNMGTVV